VNVAREPLQWALPIGAIGVLHALCRDEKPVPTRRKKPAKKYRIAR
jgi:hypothetical protein